MRALRTGALLLAFCLAACSHAHTVTVKPAVVAPPTPVRPLVAVPGPGELPQYPVPELKPAADAGAAQVPAATGGETPSQGTAGNQPAASATPGTTQGSAGGQPAAPVAPGTTGNPSQPSATVAPSTASAPAALVATPGAEYDPDRLVGLSEVEAMNLLGPPVDKAESPPSRVWTYRSQTCDVKLFFYPEVGGTTYRTLTYEINDRDPADTTHGGCVGGLVRAHAD
jgi:hypothetical protein